jgi:lipid II:glycine glycyltransferase (peptidoglycan interpeptide bridge formation enzyme)
MIRKAQKSGVRIFWGRSPQLYTSFISMYNATMDKDKAENYYYFKRPFYESLLNDLKYNSLMFYAVYNNEIVAMSFILYANQQMHYHLSASNQDYRSLAPTNLLLYEAACWGCDNGFKTFHLGGGVGSQEDSLYKFKIAFNKISKNTFSIGRKIFNQAMYDELVLLRTEVGELDRKSSFFPLYRA